MRLLSNITKEFRLGWRSHLFTLTFLLALLYFLVIAFIIPDDAPFSLELVVLNKIQIPNSAETLHNTRELSESNITLVSERSALEAAMEKNRGSIGVVISGDLKDPFIEIIFQGHESEETRRIVSIALLSQLSQGVEHYDSVSLVQIGDQADGPIISTSESLLPIFLLSEAALMGMMFIFALAFAENAQKTVSAFAVTPGKLWEYLGSKIVFLILLGIIFTLILTPLIVGLNANYGYLILVVSIGSFFSASVALIFASFYKSMSDGFMPMMALFIIFFLPAITYFFPTFRPWYIRIIPTYSILFSLKEAVFPGSTQVGLNDLLWPTALGLIAFLTAVQIYKLRISKA